MLIIIGLGNPGKEYQKTPHNLGFMAIEEIAKENEFPGFRLSKKFKAEISEGEISGQKTVLAKPQTFMNESGKAVKAIFNFPSFAPPARFDARRAGGASAGKQFSSLLVIHDDIDLPLGEIKISENRGSAGHKGVESIIKALKTKDFTRIRAGIGSDKTKKLKDVVLQKFNKQELKIAETGIKKVSEALKTIITNGLEKAMNEHN
ncbi:MAG: aminoacyl-tRNA hydrolase [Patescibacteria group bacterium]